MRVLAIAAVLLLAGCAASPSATTPSASPSPSATPSATASASPSPSPSPAPSETAGAYDCPEWSDEFGEGMPTIAPFSFADLCLGMTFDEARDKGAPVTSPEMCPWFGEIVAMDDLGFYVISLADEDGGMMMFIVRWFNDPAEAPALEMPATAEGIMIGSTEAQVLAAYPDAREVAFDDIARGPREQLIVTTSPTTTYNFDITDGLVSEISWGENLDLGGPNGDLCAL